MSSTVAEVSGSAVPAKMIGCAAAGPRSPVAPRGPAGPAGPAAPVRLSWARTAGESLERLTAPRPRLRKPTERVPIFERVTDRRASSLVSTAASRIWARPTLLRGSVCAAYAPPPRTRKTAIVAITFAYVSRGRSARTVNRDLGTPDLPLLRDLKGAS